MIELAIVSCFRYELVIELAVVSCFRYELVIELAIVSCFRYELVNEDSSSLQDYIRQGDNRNARLHTQIVASQLNRLSSSSQQDVTPTASSQSDGRAGVDDDDDVMVVRKKIRRAILGALRDLPLRDEVYNFRQHHFMTWKTHVDT